MDIEVEYVLYVYDKIKDCVCISSTNMHFKEIEGFGSRGRYGKNKRESTIPLVEI